MMEYEEMEYLGYDDVEMFLRKYTPVQDVKGVVIGIHGLGAHSGTIEFVAKHFAKNGYVCYTPDLRAMGHWQGEKGHIDSFDEYLLDIHRLIGTVRSQHMSDSLFLYGHSLGGMIIIMYLAKHKESIDGAIIASPSVSERLEVSKGTRVMAKLLAALNIKKKFDNGLNYDLISRNQDVCRRNRDDPLRYDRVTPKYAIEGLKARARSALMGPELTTPVLIVQPLEDQIVIPSKSKEFYETVASEDKSYKEYPVLFHEPFEEPGGEEVLADFISWLDERSIPQS
jgi:alpha-beta hydrolase superfamily lysophospholipase